MEVFACCGYRVAVTVSWLPCSAYRLWLPFVPTGLPVNGCILHPFSVKCSLHVQVLWSCPLCIHTPFGGQRYSAQGSHSVHGRTVCPFSLARMTSMRVMCSQGSGMDRLDRFVVILESYTDPPPLAPHPLKILDWPHRLPFRQVDGSLALRTRFPHPVTGNAHSAPYRKLW